MHAPMLQTLELCNIYDGELQEFFDHQEFPEEKRSFPSLRLLTIGQQNDSFEGVWDGLAASFPSITRLGVYTSELDACFDFLGLQDETLGAPNCWPNLDVLTLTYRITENEKLESASSDLKTMVEKRRDAGIPITTLVLSKDILEIVMQEGDLDWLKKQLEVITGVIHCRSWDDDLEMNEWPPDGHNIVVSQSCIYG